jgi:hypothetical protein
MYFSYFHVKLTKMKHLVFLTAAILLTTGAFAVNVADKTPTKVAPGGDSEKPKATQSSQSQALLFDLTRFSSRGDSTATIGTFGNADRLHKISPDMFRENKGL